MIESYCARSRITSSFFADLTRVNNTGNERTNTWRNTTAVNFPTRRRHTTADYRTITLTPPATFLPTHAFSLGLDSLVHTASSVHTTYSGIEAVQRLHPLTLALLVATGSRLRWLYCVLVLLLHCVLCVVRLLVVALIAEPLPPTPGRPRLCFPKPGTDA